MTAKPKPVSKTRKATTAVAKSPGSLAGIGGAIMGAAQFIPAGSPWQSYLTIGGAIISTIAPAIAGFVGMKK